MAKIKTQKIDPEKWYTIPQVAEMGQIGLFPAKSKKHIKRLIESGKLKGVDIGARSKKEWRVLGKDLLAFIEDSNIHPGV
ncbi:helix-turn-helix domain-containing protein [bacterium]|nr:helix-turn-helix domain-containing protein [bacterium]